MENKIKDGNKMIYEDWNEFESPEICIICKNKIHLNHANAEKYAGREDLCEMHFDFIALLLDHLDSYREETQDAI